MSQQISLMHDAQCVMHNARVWCQDIDIALLLTNIIKTPGTMMAIVLVHSFQEMPVFASDLTSNSYSVHER
jgi:hypothetical protein